MHVPFLREQPPLEASRIVSPGSAFHICNRSLWRWPLATLGLLLSLGVCLKQLSAPAPVVPKSMRGATPAQEQHLDDLALVHNETPAVSSLASVVQEEDTFRAILKMQLKPPYWFIIGSGIAKPPIMMKVFGPPKADGKAPAGLTKNAMAAFFIGLSGMQAFTDVSNIFGFVAAANLNFWERIIGVVFSLSLSSNIQTYSALAGLHAVMGASWMWRVGHGLTDMNSSSELTLFTQGLLWWRYYRVMRIYEQINNCLLGFLSLGFLAYIYLTLPFAVLMFVLGFRIAKYSTLFISATSNPVPARTGDELEVALIQMEDVATRDPMLLAMNAAQHLKQVRDESSLHFSYKKQHDHFNAIGSPVFGLREYFFGPLVSLILPLFGPVVCRLYMGVGYDNSIVETWNDRHASSYFEGLFSKATKASESIAVHWTLLMSYFM